LAADAWRAIRIEPSIDRQQIVDALFDAGSQGVQEDGAAIVTHFPPDADVAAVESRIRKIDPHAAISITDAPSLDWSEWRANVREHRLGRITISPPWLADSVEGEIVVSIDPAMAFGTGEHATTRGVVRLMQQIQSIPEVVADLGAGSAVLAICAAKLGAKRVAAIELDHDAIGNAEENVRVNDVSTVVSVVEGDAGVLLPLVAPVGLVLANIISSVLLGMLNVIHDSLTPHGNAILSGILVDEREVMLAAISQAGFTVAAEDTEEGWWSVLLELPQ
jgi:ribosomal protein L11 methyltransferase